MTEALIAGGVVLLIAFVRKLEKLTFAHIDWKVVELKFSDPHKVMKKPTKAKAPRTVKAPKASGQLKSVKRLPR